MIQNYIIEGVDRLGKGTLIQGIKNTLGYFQVIHYQKPELLDAYLHSDHFMMADAKKDALFDYQFKSFVTMFDMLNLGGFIMDRSHIGEAVYAHRYRGYPGDYVFDLEFHYSIGSKSNFRENTALILLTTSDFSFIMDDGLSHDFSKKEEEQEDFKKAFERSVIKNKVMIDVSRDGKFKPADEILNTVLEM